TAMGFFARRCIDANLGQFDGAQSQTAKVAAARGSAIGSVAAVAIRRGVTEQHIWGLAPRMPQADRGSQGGQKAAELKGKRPNATGAGGGSSAWRMGREALMAAGLSVDAAQFIAARTAGRLPGLVAGHIEAVALHPEEEYLAGKQKPGLNVLVRVVEL